MMDNRRQLARFTAIFAGGTMLSRVLGLVREMVIAALLPRRARDVFYFAFQFPNMLRDLVGEGASNAAFIPVLSETLEKEGPEAFRRLTASLLSAMLLLLGAITVAGLFLIPLVTQFLQWIAPFTGGRQFSPGEAAEVTTFTRWFFPYIFFIGLTVFQMGPLFIMRHYSTPSWAPALLNVTIIAACWLMRDRFDDPVYALVVGVWAGGIAQFAVQNRAMRKHAGVWMPSFDLRHPGIRTAFLLLIPVILGQSAGEVNKFVNNTFAYSLGEGVRSALWNANIVVQLPLSIFGIAISSAILPSISRAAAREDFLEARDTLMQGLRQCYFLVAPAVAALLALSVPIIRLLFERGEFSPDDTVMTATAMAYLAVGLLFFAWVKIAVAGFYAVKDTRTPVAIAFVSMLFNVLLLMLLVRPLGYLSLALATTLSFSLNFLLLYVFLSRRYGLLWDHECLSSLTRISIAALIAAALFYGIASAIRHFWPHDSLLIRFAMVALPITVGGAAYFAVCRMFKLPELADFTAILSRPVPARRPGPSVPGPGDV